MDYAAGNALWGLSVMLVIAIAMFVFGFWGRRKAAMLLGAGPHNQLRARKERQLRRGAVVWQIVAVLFAAIAITGIANIVTT
jgi:hypothetical protein